jgi:hypothetical protein
MGLKTELKALVNELDRMHIGATPWAEDIGFPDFVTAENGMQRHFTQKARKALWQFSRTLHDNRPLNSPKIELEEYGKIVRQSVADMHAADEFLGFDESDPGDLLTRLKSRIEDRIACIANEYTHYFPAWTLGME